MKKATCISLLITCSLCLSVLANAAQPGGSPSAGGVNDSAVLSAPAPDEEFANYIAAGPGILGHPGSRVGTAPGGIGGT
jgi:hypothetical protein